MDFARPIHTPERVTAEAGLGIFNRPAEAVRIAPSASSIASTLPCRGGVGEARHHPSRAQVVQTITMASTFAGRRAGR
jgi:hypothetical protein